jgi:hypothetical protein
MRSCRMYFKLLPHLLTVSKAVYWQEDSWQLCDDMETELTAM